jgi:RHS repeat-associated protein
VIDYTRDFLGRVTQTVPQGLPAEAVTYTWDTGGLAGSYGIGRLGKVEDASGTTQFQYDHRGNLLAKQQTIGSTSAAQLAYTYDTADRITQIAYPSGRLVQYSYDSKGRISAVETKAQASDPSWTLIANGFGYEAFGPLTAMTFGNGLAVAKTYGTDSLLASSRLYRTSDSMSLSDLVYRHDSDGNIGAIIDQLDDANSLIFGYDGLDRLSMTIASAGGTAASYSYASGTNQLASVTDASGTRTIAYDDRGNIASETRPASISLSTSYDGYGRLTSYARTDLGTATFFYNGLDDRVTMSLPTAGMRHFVYDVAGRAMGEYGSSASDVQAEFIWLQPEKGAGGVFDGGDGIGGYVPLAIATPNSSAMIELNWIYGDHLGTPIIETDASGASATTPDDYLAAVFPGQSRLFADLYYNRYRDYDPTTGRYIEADPIGLAGWSNPYLYADANPVNAIDPLGLKAFQAQPGDIVLLGSFGPMAYVRDRVIPALQGAKICVDPWEVGADLVIGAGLTLAGDGLFRSFAPGNIPRFLGRLLADEGGAFPRMGQAVPDSAIVCRGGSCTVDSFEFGRGVTSDAAGRLSGVSTGIGDSVKSASANIPHPKVGVTTAGDIRAAGGHIINDHGNHATVSGITAEQAASLFNVVANPNK